LILGVDPGIRNTGWCIISSKTGRAGRHGVIQPPGAGNITTEWAVQYTLNKLGEIIAAELPCCASVEQVVWQGRRRRIAIPLAHVAGAIVGFILGQGIPVYVLTPNMKPKDGVVPLPDGWSEHEGDAANLARVARMNELAVIADEDSPLLKRSAVNRRRITVARPARGQY
jgi:hypothetical protein